MSDKIDARVLVEEALRQDDDAARESVRQVSPLVAKLVLSCNEHRIEMETGRRIFLRLYCR